MYTLKSFDIELLRTPTLLVWLRRPEPDHPNWWLGRYSEDPREAEAWRAAIEGIASIRFLMPFHQIAAGGNGPDVWEMWGARGSDRALLHPFLPLDELRSAGEPGLEKLLAVWPEIQRGAFERLNGLS